MSDVVISAAKSFPNPDTLALLSDVQYFEPYSSGAVNRKLRGIVSPGIYTGFTPSAAGGLTLLISSGDDGGTASIDIGKLYQISIRQQEDITLEMTAGKTAIVILEATYVIGQETYQVNASSSIQAASIKLLEAGTELNSNQLELCTVTVPSGATELTDEMIDISNRKLVTLGTEYSNDYDSDDEDKAITPKGVKEGLAKKQPLDKTLSELSGKTVEEILEYLGLGIRGIATFTASGSWTCPEGVTTVYIDACGGGGGGAYSSPGATGGGGGGGAAAVIGVSISVTPGTTYAITVGGPGAAGTPSSVNGVASGATSFGSLLALNGGGGGLSSAGAGTGGGTGGNAGTAGALNGGVSFGGSGGGCVLGNGGPGGNGAMFGTIPGQYGGGGGGGANGGSGARGAYGILKLRW